MASVSLQIVRRLFGIAEQVAPGPAGRAAFALFCRTPDPKRMSPKAQKALADAVSFMDRARRHNLTSDYGSFLCYEFRPPSGGIGKGTIIVVHGWGSRTEHMRYIIQALLAKGFRVLALDLPGHGATGGRDLNLAKGVAAVKMVELWFAPIYAIIGHSFGGAVAVNAAAGSIRGVAPVSTRRLVLISTPNAMQPLFEASAQRLKLGPASRKVLFDQVERVTGYPLPAFVGTKQLAGLSMPTLVLHAPDDREVEPANADAFAEAGPHVRREWIAGAGHRRILSDSGTLARISEFLL